MKLRAFTTSLSILGAFAVLTAIGPGSSLSQSPSHLSEKGTADDDAIVASPSAGLQEGIHALRRGRRTFRHDTFGSERFFTDELGLDELVRGLPPATALELGLKVDVDALPRRVVRALRRGEVDLQDPATTTFLLSRSAVVGLSATVEAGEVSRIGITCALCHSTVDDSLAPGVGGRLDGWANRDLNVGAILAASPRLTPFEQLLGVSEETVREVLNSWGPGKFDAHLNLDGQPFQPNGRSAAVLIPPAFGLAGINLATYNGWGSVPYWNALVSNLEMSGHGTFLDQRLDAPATFPIAAREGFGDIRRTPDRTTGKLADLHVYQLALQAPRPPESSFDEIAAARGSQVFQGQGQCSSCHVPPLYTEPGYNLHEPEDIGIDSFQADRGPEGKYRTTPLAGLWSHSRGGFYHDGRFASLDEVVAHYDEHFELELSTDQKRDLVQFLLSI